VAAQLAGVGPVEAEPVEAEPEELVSARKLAVPGLTW
jgi:hypothetical protein